MRRTRKVKILATLGPASATKSAIASLFAAGADVFRINMSHASHEDLRTYVTAIREIERDHGRSIGILADLQGPKLRIGQFADHAVVLPAGAMFTLDASPAPGDASRVQLPHPEILAALHAGHRLLLDDGKVVLRVTDTTPDTATTVVETGGELSDHKGISVPDSTLAFGALSAKDRSDLEAALNAGVDWIAVSFIQRAEDLAEVKKIARGKAGVLAKIEKPQAVQHLADIIEQADALMVARGDLGIEMPLEKVPGIQKQITRAARRAGKPVVVATQMLESMITAPVPTRAEVSDVATAVFEGADAVMLSAEFGDRRVPGRDRGDDGQDRLRGRTRPELPGDPSRAAHRPRADRRRRGVGRRAPDRRNAEPRRDLLLHRLRHDSHARRARAAQPADRGVVAGGRDGAAPVAGVGAPLHRRRGTVESGRHGPARRRRCERRGLRGPWRTGHHHRWCTTRYARRDEHAEDRVRSLRGVIR